MLCVRAVLVDAKDYDVASRREIVAVLLDVVGVPGIIDAAATSPAAFAGLLDLPGDLSLIDDCRRNLALGKKDRAKKFFQRLLDEAKLSMDSPQRVAAVAKAFLGTDRFKRDMVGPLLPKPAADVCRSLRNLAERSEVTPTKPTPQKHWRYQDLRLHSQNGLRYRDPRTTPPPRSPHFPGYDH